MIFPVFDLHCDTATALLGEDLLQSGSLRSNQYHWDLVRAGENPGFAQCFACFSTTNEGTWSKKSPVDFFEMQLAGILRQVQNNSDKIRIAYNAEDITENLKQGIGSAVLTIEGTAGFGFDPDLLGDLYAAGFRMTTLGWNESNPLAGSHITGEGLSDLGREYVRKAQKAGMIVDVSHISDQAFYDIMDITDSAVIASHSNSREVWNVSRNLTDSMFKEICNTGGVAGINLYADFIGKDPDLDTVCDHILHFLELDPEGNHIALGGDLDGCDKLCSGFNGVQDYPKLANKLLERGVSEALVYNIFWNNAVGVMGRCCT